MEAQDIQVVKTANFIAREGFGILAADEGPENMGNRFKEVGIENTPENRRLYRQMVFTSPKIEDCISGVILCEEAINQKSNDGRYFSDLLIEKGIRVGITVDKGFGIIPGTKGETYTQGLDGLADRCKEYYKRGCTFAKWRAKLVIETGALPSRKAILQNARTLARYASICQKNNLMPIVEPDIAIAGDHTIETSAAVSQQVWREVIHALHEEGVLLEGILLKPSMITPGISSSQKVEPERVGEMTVRVLRRTIPPAVIGIMFLSGGQSEEVSTQNLKAINDASKVKNWALSFCFGRALLNSSMRAFNLESDTNEAAKAAFTNRCIANKMAITQ